MDLQTAQRIDALLANEVFASFINPVDIANTLTHKQIELSRLIVQDNKPGIRQCCYEIAAITIKFLESGLVSP
jgi:hypothetical protein